MFKIDLLTVVCYRILVFVIAWFFVWSYSNPIGYRFFEETFDKKLQEAENQHRKEFQNWFDGMLFVHIEMQQQTHLQSPRRNDTAIAEKEKEESSSSVEPKWGRRTRNSEEESLRMWE